MYDTIVGLGRFGSQIASKFKFLFNTEILIIDADDKCKEKSFIRVEKCATHEGYEKLGVVIPNKHAMQDKHVLFCVCGVSTVSGLTLSILEQLKKNNNKISILYFYPEMSFLPKVKKMQHNVVFGVLQEYTRSGVFDEFLIVSEKKISSIIPGITLVNKYDKIDDFLCQTVGQVLYYQNQEQLLMGNHPQFTEHYRIGTLGVMNPETGEEFPFFDLSLVNDLDSDNVFVMPDEKHYYYIVPQKEAEENTELSQKLFDLFDKKVKNKERITFSVHSSEKNTQDYSCFIHKTSNIQK